MKDCLWLPSIPWCECWFQDSLQFKTEREGISRGTEEDFYTDLGLPKCWTRKKEQQETAFPILRHALDARPLVCFVIKIQSLYWARYSFLYMLAFSCSLFSMVPWLLKLLTESFSLPSGQFTTESIYSCVPSSITHPHQEQAEKRPKTWSVMAQNIH